MYLHILYKGKHSLCCEKERARSRLTEKHMERGSMNLEVLLSKSAANGKTIIVNYEAV